MKLDGPLARLKRRVAKHIERPSQAAMTRRAEDALAKDEDEDPPVIGRLVVEIRSDGARTIARGAIEDAQSEQRMALEARAATPAQLAALLARRIISLPVLLRSAARGAGAASPPPPLERETPDPECDR